MQILNYIKLIAKKLRAISPIALGMNEQYDRLTKKIIFLSAKPGEAFIDIGANKGKILSWMIKATPDKMHFAFEPIPVLFESLEKTFRHSANIFQLALSDSKSISKFNLVLTDYAYSGLKKRPYHKMQSDTTIEVQTDLLDNHIPANQKISLIKIDVEGGEFDVLKGAENTIRSSRPIIIFECGKIGGDIYGFSALEIFNLLSIDYQYDIYTLHNWLAHKSSLTFNSFHTYYETGKEFFFLAAPKS